MKVGLGVAAIRGFLKGFIYRRATDIRELGERLGWRWLVRLGYRIRGFVRRGGV
jgi:hypothetical protein